MNAPILSAETTATIIKDMKDGFKKNENKVEVVAVNEFMTQFGQLGAACEVLGIKLHDVLGEVRIFEGLISGLRMHGHKTFEMHFPDGDKYEVVMRYREGDTHVRSFGYKL